MGLLALGGLGATLAVQVAQSEVKSRVEAMAARKGLRLTVGSVDVPLSGLIALKDVQVFGVDPEAPGCASAPVPLATIARLETDISLWDAIGGQRRPTRVDITGLDSHLVITEAGVTGLGGFFGPRADAGPPADTSRSPSTLPALRFVDSHVSVDLSWGPYAAERIAWTSLSGHVDPAGGLDDLTLALAGIAQVGEQRVAVSLSRPRHRPLSLRLESPMVIGVSSPKGPFWAGIEAVTRSAGETRLAGLSLRRGHDVMTAKIVTAKDGDEGLLPSPRTLEAITVEGFAVARGPHRLVAGHLTLRLNPPEPAGSLPIPRRLDAEDIGVASSFNQLSGTFGTVRIRLADFWEHMRSGRPLDAIRELTLARPRLAAVIPRDSLSLSALLPTDQDATPDAAVVNADTKTTQTTETAEATGATGANGSADPNEPPGPIAERAPGPDLAASVRPGRGDALATLTRRLLPHIRRWHPSILDGVVDIKDTDGNPLLALRPLSITTAVNDDQALVLTLDAEVNRAGDRTGNVRLEATLDAAGYPTLVQMTLAGRDIAHQLSRFSDKIAVQPDSEVELALTYHPPPPAPPRQAGDAWEAAPHRIDGRILLRNFTFEWWRVSDQPVTDLEGEVTFDMVVDPQARHAKLNLNDIRVGAVRLIGSLDIALPRGEPLRFDARLKMPLQDCGPVARAIPPALIPRLPWLSLKGKMRFDARLAIDFADPRALELKVRGDMDRCEIRALGPNLHLDRLKGDFVHRPLEPGRGRLTHIQVGRGTDSWLTSAELGGVGDLIKATAWVTEDRLYFDHGGVRWDLIERALKIDLANGRFIYGGSTITQQLVKNLYLDRGKTMGRKLEEAFIAVQMERLLTKDEILTIYVNVIEYGPEIYGLKNAARYYFDKEHDALEPIEVAFIMGLKPYPYKGWLQWKKQRLDPWWVRRVRHVIGMLLKRSDALTPEEALYFQEVMGTGHGREAVGVKTEAFQPRFRPIAPGDLEAVEAIQEERPK